jgi:hypothetical protein
MSRTILRSADIQSELLYYNLDVVNGSQYDNGTSDPVLKFEETRSQSIIKDASRYNFSIVRFSMDGPNKDLPLFIPTIKST